MPPRRAAASLCAALVALGCGENERPKPDREQIRDVVRQFFHDAADGDVEAVCAALTGTGRAQAAGRGSITGHLPEPVSEDRCIEKHAHTATSSVDLPQVVDALRIERVRIRGSASRAFVCNSALCRPQMMRKQGGSWKIQSFQLPVSD